MLKNKMIDPAAVPMTAASNCLPTSMRGLFFRSTERVVDTISFQDSGGYLGSIGKSPGR
jgi:hypothetical protein